MVICHLYCKNRGNAAGLRIGIRDWFPTQFLMCVVSKWENSGRSLRNPSDRFTFWEYETMNRKFLGLLALGLLAAGISFSGKQAQGGGLFSCLFGGSGCDDDDWGGGYCGGYCGPVCHPVCDFDDDDWCSPGYCGGYRGGYCSPVYQSMCSPVCHPVMYRPACHPTTYWSACHPTYCAPVCQPMCQPVCQPVMRHVSCCTPAATCCQPAPTCCLPMPSWCH